MHPGLAPVAEEGIADEVADRCFRIKRKLDDGGDPKSAIALAKAGDKLAFQYLYLRYADNVFSFVRTIVHDDHDAEDVTQQVFTKLLTAIQRYEERGVPFSAWILRIARNAAIDHLRRDRMVLCDDVRATEHEADEIGRDRRWSLTEGLERLPQDQRQVVMLRHVAGLSPPEIAKRLGKTEGAVHALHHRGRRALRGYLAAARSAPALAPSES